jgi:hypothetical protein
VLGLDGSLVGLDGNDLATSVGARRVVGDEIENLSVRKDLEASLLDGSTTETVGQ